MNKRGPAFLLSLFIVLGATLFSGCKKQLDNVVYGDLSSTVTTPQFANATVVAAYTGLVGGDAWQGGWGAAYPGWRVQAMEMTDEGVCAWGPTWGRLNNLDMDPDFDWVQTPYLALMPYLSRITIGIDQVQKISMDESLKKQYIAEMKALRANYAQTLYLIYGPLTIKTDPAIAINPDAPATARPSNADMVKQIIADYTDAIDILPVKFSGNDYGRFTKGAALTGLMKLYMQEKRWGEAVTTGEKIKALGYSLTPNYEDVFSMKAKNGANAEIIAAVVCSSKPNNYTKICGLHMSCLVII
ncbi:RagB/SusD family nutrient uptake outer membrane protein [Pedobacter sp. NJ-S-72]